MAWLLDPLRKLTGWIVDQDSLAYLAVLIPTALALGAILLEWREKFAISTRRKFVGAGLALLTLAGGAVAVGTTHHQIRDAAARDTERAREQETIKRLTSASEGTNGTVNVLLDRVIGLESQVQTEALRMALAETKAQLVATQESLKPKPVPLAQLDVVALDGENAVFPPDKPTVPVIDGVARVRFLLRNNTDVNAQNVVAWLRVCEICEFAGDVAGFKQGEGCPTGQRQASIDRMWANSRSRAFEVPVRVGQCPAGPMRLGVRVVCDNCPLEGYHDLDVILAQK